jgi:hypothetical protein
MIAALAVIALSIFGLCQLSGLWNRVTPLPMPTETAVPAATATLVPTGTPTEMPTPTTEPSATPVPVLMPGVHAMVSGSGSLQLRLRAGPGLNQELLLTLEDGTRLELLEGPQTVDGFSWWKVETEDGIQGWAAGDWLVPSSP